MADSTDIELQNKQYLHAARTDDAALLQSLLDPQPDFDQNHVDGLGNNALHYAAAHQSTEVLGDILDLEIDVDAQNRIDANTPLHEAVKVDIDGPDAERKEELRNWIVNELLESGADPRIQNKDGDKPVDLLSYGRKANTALGKQLYERLKRAEAEVAVDQSDIARDDDDDEGSEGTPSDDE
ncbi:uncharacterized protein PFL1_06565 [Pseudozyma flocculosa PF-1]|uniref:Uncharacterized protein n=2 Tax=Pseudozyma flocculosa TaxID=84751 RepID=A0A5C3F7Z6_9BASI|nr:uncharacterized protein PFL1_06565 [Pseudozyma flocculosa PF-1]EPQ25891.1 hypothetical protein PFL1_06565 [Pseudozyma flocculosa PF-1]SPO40608.1 uncharacterized protein PSFLO_06090 [Pseudozyma flocculosa]